MKKQIKSQTKSYYLKFLSDKYCSYKDNSMPLKFNATEEYKESTFSTGNVYKNSNNSNNK